VNGEKPTEPKQPNKLLHVISTHPFGVSVAFLAAIATLTAWPFAVFPWLASAKRDLSYCINPVRTPIIRAEKRSEISITYKGLTVIGDVTAAQIAIWNAGREPIKSEDVLSPVVLKIPKDILVFEIRVVETNRAINAFRIESLYTNAQSICMKLNWRILERGDGALIQVIYSGSTDTPLELEGIIVGQNSPNKKASNTKSISAVPFILLGVIFITIFLIDPRFKYPGLRYVLNAVMFCLALICLILALLLFLQGRGTTTPFGF